MGNFLVVQGHFSYVIFLGCGSPDLFLRETNGLSWWSKYLCHVSRRRETVKRLRVATAIPQVAISIVIWFLYEFSASLTRLQKLLTEKIRVKWIIKNH